MVEVVKERKIQSGANFDAGLLQSTLTDLKGRILDLDDQQDEDNSETFKPQFNFSNVLKLALGDCPLFCLERSMSSEFFEGVVNILLRYRSSYSIVETCLRFLLNFVSSIDNPGFGNLLISRKESQLYAGLFQSSGTNSIFFFVLVRNICLCNRLVKFLSQHLQLKKGHPIINSLAFKLMAILVEVVDADGVKCDLRKEVSSLLMPARYSSL